MIFDSSKPSMETKLDFPSSPFSAAPRPPLQGYFRFRQKMVNTLPLPFQNSEEMVKMWNQLTSEQKQAQKRQISSELEEYNKQMNIWLEGQKIPQRLKETTLFLNENITDKEIQISETNTEVACEVSEVKTNQTYKSRPIKKMSKKNQRTSQKNRP